MAENSGIENKQARATKVTAESSTQKQVVADQAAQQEAARANPGQTTSKTEQTTTVTQETKE